MIEIKQHTYASLKALDITYLFKHIYDNKRSYDLPNEQYFKTAFTVLEKTEIVGVVCCFINPHISKDTLLIGGYEAVGKKQVAELLFKAVQQVAEEHNISKCVGPINGSTWNKHRFNLEQKQPFLGENQHPAYYVEQWRENGFELDQTYLSTKQTKVQKDDKHLLYKEKLVQKGIQFRKIDLSDLENELNLVYPLVCAAFEKNIYYSPISLQQFKEEIISKADILDADIIWLAFDNTTCVGFVFCLHNLIDTEKKGIIAKTLARHPDKKYAGMGTAISGFINTYMKAQKIDYIIHAFMHNRNVSNKVSANFLGEEMNTYALFKKRTNENCIYRFYQNFDHKKANVALQLENESVSFEQLEDLIQRKVTFFQQKGIKQGDRVVVLLGISKTLYVNLLALFFIGAIPVIVDKWSGFKRIKQSIQLVNAKAYIGSRKVKRLSIFLKALRNISVYLEAEGYAKNLKQQPVNVGKNDPALITFTTGSTGIPKGAIRTHQNLNAQFAQLARKLHATEEDLVITNLPIVLLINLGKGASTYIPSIALEKLNALKSKELSDKLRQIKPTILVGSPYFAKKMCSTVPELNYKQIIIGGGPVFPKDAQDLITQQPNTKIEVVYGSTECEPVASTGAINVANSTLKRGLLVGSVNPKTNLKLIDIHTNLEISRPHTIGEILVAGKHAVARYFNNPTAMKENKIELNGVLYHKMGDAGSLDVRGNLYLHGRVKYLPRENSKLFSLLSAEEQLNQIKEVLEATVIHKEGKNQLFYVAHTKIDVYALQDSLPFQIGNITKVKALPKDKRHNTKIDYGRL